jgi:hypothetical protein
LSLGGVSSLPVEGISLELSSLTLDSVQPVKIDAIKRIKKIIETAFISLIDAPSD